jgi:two-component system chemotaxis sensor kinase CheA
MAERPSQKALAEFVSEAQETIEALDRDLLRLEDARQGREPDPDALNAVFRAAHSLKGLSAMFGVERMTTLAHALEDLLDDVRMGRRPLDAATLDLLLGAPAIFNATIGEEAGQKPAATAEQVQVFAAKLRAAPAPPVEAADPLEGLELEPAVRSVLTEYEEHRLRTALARPGARLYRVGVRFDLATFDAGLDELKNRLKPLGEVISTLPSPGAADPDAIAFDVLFGSAEALERVRTTAGEGAGVEEIARRGGGAARSLGAAASPPPTAGTPAPTATPPLTSTAAATSTPASAAVPGAAPLPPRARLVKPELAASAPTPAEADASLRSVSQAVRVDIRKLDRLMNLVGELVLVKTSLLGIAERLRAGEDPGTLGLELHREGRSLQRKLNELQGGVLEVRMVPLGQIFDKLSRMARKLSRELAKQIEFRVVGSDVEVDKLIVEDLSDPLMHLIRNALDHAMEPPAQRSRVGKSPTGKLTLSAVQKGNHVVITVEDDGAGIDAERVRQAAVERGLVTAEAVAQLSRREVLNLIFLPGFSTARQVTALSGRGVGMDVVKNNIAAMSGIIDIWTEPGRGTRFEITLPVTLAIVRALVVQAAGRTYAIPLNGVLEIVTVDPGELRTIEQREVLSLRGATLPLVRLSRFFETPGDPPAGPLHVVVVGLAQERLGMAVDALVGQQDVVVKPLGRALAGVRGIAGATDLGNRRTVLVLDVGAVIAETHGAGFAGVAGRQ